MKTDESIASEAADQMVCYAYHEVSVGPALCREYRGVETAEAVAYRTRRYIAEGILAAIHEAVRQVPGEVPADSAFLDMVQRWIDAAAARRVQDGGKTLLLLADQDIYFGACSSDVVAEALIRLKWAYDRLQHLTALLLRDESGVAYAAGHRDGRDAGFEAGTIAQRASDVESVASGEVMVAGTLVSRCVELAQQLCARPLARPPV